MEQFGTIALAFAVFGPAATLLVRRSQIAFLLRIFTSLCAIVVGMAFLLSVRFQANRIEQATNSYPLCAESQGMHRMSLPIPRGVQGVRAAIVRKDGSPLSQLRGVLSSMNISVQADRTQATHNVTQLPDEGDTELVIWGTEGTVSELQFLIVIYSMPPADASVPVRELAISIQPSAHEFRAYHWASNFYPYVGTAVVLWSLAWLLSAFYSSKGTKKSTSVGEAGNLS